MDNRFNVLAKEIGTQLKTYVDGIVQPLLKTIDQQNATLSELSQRLKTVEENAPDESAIASAVYAQIELPTAPELPDIEGMVKSAVEGIAIPEPEAPELPDFYLMIQRAVSEFPMPEPEPLPDIGLMIREAVSQEVFEQIDAIPRPQDGRPGEDGRDAVDIEILPAIDSEKSYPRGTFATHNGGLWRAYQKTVGMTGWECIVDGVNSFTIVQDDERHFTLESRTAAGQVVGKQFSLPVMIYRDVYSQGKTYHPGDTVTFGGNLWHCFEKHRLSRVK